VGCFVLKQYVLLEELKAFHPEVYENQNYLSNTNGRFRFSYLWIPSISIDYAVMERKKKNKKWYPHNLTGLIWFL
jgi:mannose-1-phosphate guanylyltransferase